MAQQVGETGSGQPGCNTVLRVRHLDLDPLRELPCRPAVDDRARGRTDGSIRLRVTTFLMFSLALKGASTDVARIGPIGSGAGRCRTTAPFLTLGPLPCRSKPRQPVVATLRSSSTGSSTRRRVTLAYAPAAASRRKQLRPGE